NIVVGGTSSAMTLTGSITAINAFIAFGNVSFTTAQDATDGVILYISIDDNGHTGMGGSRTNSTTVYLSVKAVNDAPEISGPDMQAMDQDDTLIFHTADNNRIVISDVDAEDNHVQLALTVTDGTLTLGSVTGLSFLVGGGANDAAMTFEGTLADINNALDGLQFKPTAGYNGPASL